jgi:GNAT superfamily N-acetyltransferase
MPDKNIIDYKEIAELHKLCINQGFLSTLGESFLAFIYEAIDSDPHSILLVEKINDRVVGFLAGGQSMKYVYWQMFKRWPRLIFSLFPEIINVKKLIRIFELVWFSLKNKPYANKKMPELFSIAVLDAERNKGIAQRLYKTFALRLSQRGESAFYILVGDTLEAAHRFYIKAGAKPIAKVRIHNGNISTMYQQNLLLVR